MRALPPLSAAAAFAGWSACYAPGGSTVGLPPALPVPVVGCDGLASGEGDGTWYDADGGGACGFSPTPGPSPLLVAAMNQDDWAGALPCGACAEVVGPHGAVTVTIVDLCPECVRGDLDLSPQAFERIAPLVDGRVPIAWRLAPCDVEGPAIWHFKRGTNPWWTAVQLRNHRNQVAAIQVDPGDGWRSMPRTDWNHFVADRGLGEGPLRLRAIDLHGAVIVDEAVPLLDGEGIDASDQFPACE